MTCTTPKQVWWLTKTCSSKRSGCTRHKLVAQGGGYCTKHAGQGHNFNVPMPPVWPHHRILWYLRSHLAPSTVLTIADHTSESSHWGRQIDRCGPGHTPRNNADPELPHRAAHQRVPLGAGSHDMRRLLTGTDDRTFHSEVKQDLQMVPVNLGPRLQVTASARSKWPLRS